jgi:hypothetical protein
VKDKDFKDNFKGSSRSNRFKDIIIINLTLFKPKAI